MTHHQWGKKQRGAVKISNYFDMNLVALLDSSTREGAIDVLIDLLDQAGKLPNKTAFRKAISEREALISTGIGMGVAVPHAKLKGFKEFSIAIGIQQKKGLEWNAIDHAPVRLIFLVAGPDDRQSEYLQILSLLTIAIKDHNLRKELMRAASTQEVINAFLEF